MSSPVRCVDQEAPLSDVASLLDAHRIGRVPVLANGRVVGIVTRADLVTALARHPAPRVCGELDDREIRRRLIEELSAQEWWNAGWQSVDVAGGLVIFKGVVESEDHRLASRVAAETLPGIRGIRDERVLAAEFSGMV